MTKLLVDTNVLIYALNRDSKFNAKSTEILESNEYSLVITSKNISEFFAVCSKLKVETHFLFSFFDEIKSNAHIIYPNHESVKQFVSLMKKYSPIGNRVYDIEIISVMLAHNIDKIASFNIKDFKEVSEIKNVLEDVQF